MQGSNPPLNLTAAEIDRYLQMKSDSGVSPVAVAKYRTPLDALQRWIADDKNP